MTGAIQCTYSAADGDQSSPCIFSIPGSHGAYDDLEVDLLSRVVRPGARLMNWVPSAQFVYWRQPMLHWHYRHGPQRRWVPTPFLLLTMSYPSPCVRPLPNHPDALAIPCFSTSVSQALSDLPCDRLLQSEPRPKLSLRSRTCIPLPAATNSDRTTCPLAAAVQSPATAGPTNERVDGPYIASESRISNIYDTRSSPCSRPRGCRNSSRRASRFADGEQLYMPFYIKELTLCLIVESHRTSLETAPVLRQVVSKARFPSTRQLIAFLREAGRKLAVAQPKDM